jgi:tetratricopeptide (TPR) repeat protein
MSGNLNSRRARAASERELKAARQFVRAGRYEAAIAPLLAASRLDPSNAIAQNDLGLAYLNSGKPYEAIRWLQTAIETRPTWHVCHYNLALALQTTGDDAAAAVALGRALALMPRFPEGLLQYADLLVRHDRRSEGADAYDRAAVLLEREPGGGVCRALALRARGDDAGAEGVLRAQLAAAPSSRAHHILGVILKEAGRFEEAVCCFKRSLAMDPLAVDSYQGIVSSRRMTDADRPLLVQMREVVEKCASQSALLSAHGRMTLHFAAGKMLDDLGEYESAFANFYAANGIRRRLAGRFDVNEVRATVDRLIAYYSRERCQVQGANACRDETPVFIVGMPRSGTTLLERVLSSHASVGGAGELSFWPEHALRLACSTISEDEARRVCAEYLAVLRRGRDDILRATDKLPFNFFWVGLIHTLFPKARFIHANRDPIDSCLSIYVTPFTSLWSFAPDTKDLADYYREYDRLVRHWAEVVGAERWLDIDYEDVVAEPEDSARCIVAFCGLEWDAACLHPEDNGERVRTASVWQARQPIYRTSIERWRRYERWLDELRPLHEAYRRRRSVRGAA